MTLFRQLLLAVMALMLLLYGVNGALSLSSTRALVDDQMAVHAADAATALAVAVSQGGAGQDPALLEALFNALSDSGYYQRVEWIGDDGKSRLLREFAVAAPEVPGWFVRLIQLPDHVGRAEVMAGWNRAGEVVVVSHPGQAYRQLWTLAGRQLFWFTLATALFCAVGFLALRQLLAPLGRVVAQADAIRERRFVVQERLPRARELRSLVEAMNRMVVRLEQLFSGQAELIAELRQAAASDAVTGLANRADFDARLQALVADGGGARQGMVAILALDGLARVNDRYGRGEGNGLLRALGAELRAALEPYPEALLARRQGAEFAVFVAEVTAAEADALAADLVRRAAAVPFAHRADLPLRLRLGYTLGDAVGHGANLLEQAGRALAQITAAAAPNWCRYDAVEEGAPPLVSRTGTDWACIIQRLLDQRGLQLLCQPTVAVPGREPIGCELYSRMAAPIADAASGPAALLPMVERVGQAAAYDRLVLELLSARPPDYPRWTVNVSLQSLRSSDWLRWLEEFLGEHRAVAERLVFELPERAFIAFPELVSEFQRRVARHGCGLGVDHFGLETSNFAYLGSLPLAHVKLHRSLAQDLHRRRDGQFYVKSLAQLVHSREIALIVEGIETEADWAALASLNADGAQGFFLGRPQPLG
ncbi:MAG: EAL domain-containing protein [Pseudomonadales bacterium]|nr:EAL domain-containing protein [Pseudomonadales bacterium]